MPAALLCTVPPFATLTPPAGPAALLGYLAARGVDEFSFADLQLAFPAMPLPYNLVGAAGASFVRDVADLPLVLRLVRAFEEGRPLALAREPLFDAYCLERTIHPGRLAGALDRFGRFLEAWSARIPADFVGLTVWSSNYLTSLLAAAHLKRRPRPPFVVAGGPQVGESAAAAALGLRSGLFDAVVLGEGEATLLELYRAFREGRSTRGIAGTAWLESDGRIGRAERPLLKMADLAPPAFERTFLPAYRRQGERILPLGLSRGCVGECAFCSEWGLWGRFRPGPPGAALDEAERLVRRFGASHLQLTDSLLNGHWGRLTGFAEGLLERGLEVSWSGFLRADVDRDAARLLRRAGLRRTFVGVESLDDATLEAMNKRLDAARSLAALEALLAAGIEVQAGIIPGFPGDRPERFLDTLTRLLELGARFPGGLALNVEPFVVSPGQPLFGDLARWGLSGVGWDPRTLELAPRHREVTEAIVCRVEGAGQGLERLGQLRTVSALSAAGTAPAAPAPARAPVCFEPLDEGALLLALEAPGRTLFRLVDEAERARLEAALSAAREAGDAGLAAWEREPLRSELSAIERAHLALPQDGEPRAPGFAPDDGEARVALSPLAVARRLGGTLWAFDGAGHGLARLPARAEGDLARLLRPVRRAEAGVPAALLDALAQAGLLASYTSISR